MIRIRLSTSLLLVVILAMGIALVRQHERHRLEEAELLNQLAVEVQKTSSLNFLNDPEFKNLRVTLMYRKRAQVEAERVARNGK